MTTKVHNRMIEGAPIKVMDYGAVGDGTTDDFTALQAALDAGQGRVVDFSDAPSKSFATGKYLTVRDDTTITGSSWVKAISGNDYDTVFLPQPGAKRITIDGLKIDANNQTAMCGIIIRRANSEIQVSNLHIKNCAHDRSRKGGRALNIEAGVGPNTYGCRDVTVNGLIAEDCYSAISLQGGSENAQSANITISNVTARNCEHLVQMWGNESGYPHAASAMSATISNISGYNVGKSTTYTGKRGIFVADRASNISISNVTIANESAYVADNVFMGDFFNCQFTNFNVESDLTSMVLFARFAENDKISDDIYNTQDTVFDNIKIQGKLSENIAAASKSDANKVMYTTIKCWVANASAFTILPSNMTLKKTVYVEYYERANDARITGNVDKIGSSLSFSNIANGGRTFTDAGEIGSLVMSSNSAIPATNNSYSIGSASRAIKDVFAHLEYSVNTPNGTPYKFGVSSGGTLEAWPASGPRP